MSNFHLSHARLANGVWSAIVSGGQGVPQVEVRHMDNSVPEVSVTETEDGWRVDVPIPPEAISDGLQTFVMQDATSGETLGSFSLIAGAPLAEDLRAEIDLLRAELDMLKRAFRRHCVETA